MVACSASSSSARTSFFRADPAARVEEGRRGSSSKSSSLEGTAVASKESSATSIGCGTAGCGATASRDVVRAACSRPDEGGVVVAVDVDGGGGGGGGGGAGGCNGSQRWSKGKASSAGLAGGAGRLLDVVLVPETGLCGAAGVDEAGAAADGRDAPGCGVGESPSRARLAGGGLGGSVLRFVLRFGQAVRLGLSTSSTSPTEVAAPPSGSALVRWRNLSMLLQ